MISSPSRSLLRDERATIVRALESWLPLTEGSPWLFLLDQEDGETFEDGGIYKKVRHVTISLVEGVPQ
jgi:hypothetical protein